MTISWEAVGGLVAIAMLLATLAGAFIGYGRLKSSHEDTKRKADKALEKAEQNAREISEFREKAAREFVSISMLEKVEERVIGAIDRLADRLDRLFEVNKSDK